MRAVDDSVGRVVEALRARGLLDSTLILYTSDNGFRFGEHGLIYKRTMYEPSIRVPLIAHCPEWSKQAQRRKEMITNLDVALTILEAAGASVPDFATGPLRNRLRGESVPCAKHSFTSTSGNALFPQPRPSSACAPIGTSCAEMMHRNCYEL